MRLLVDLLEGEVREAALLGGVEAPVDLGDLALHLRPIQRQDPGPIGRHVGDVALVQDDDVLGVLEDGRHVAGEEPFAVAEPDDERDVHSRADDPIGVLGVHHGNGVRPAHLVQGGAHRLDEIARVLRLDEVGEHLGIGLRREPMALGREPVLDLGVVLDDAVVDQRELAAAVGVRVRVRVVRAAMRRPSRVGDPGMTCRRVAVEVIGQVGQLAGLLLDEELAGAGQHGDAGRVVAAVLEAPQALEQDRGGITRPDVPDDAAHMPSSRKAGSVQSCRGERRELVRDPFDLGGLVALDHDPDLGLGAGRANEDPSAIPQLRRSPIDGRGQLGVALPLVQPADDGVYHHLRQPRNLSGKLGEGALGRSHGPHELDAGQDAVASRGAVAEDDVPGLLPAEDGVLALHRLEHVAIADRRPDQPAAGRAHRPLQATVAHHGDHEDVVAERAGRQPGERADPHDGVAVHQLARARRHR